MTEIDGLPSMLKVDEAAAFLRISRSGAYEAAATYIRTGGSEGVPAVRIGRSVRIPKDALAAWLKGQLGE